MERHLTRGNQLLEWLGIRVYESDRQANGEIHWHLRKNPSDKLKNIMTIGIYWRHAFLIKDINELAKTYVCVVCRARFTQVCHLQRHANTCAQGKTVIDSPNERDEAPKRAYERTFYTKARVRCHQFSGLSTEARCWESWHIHHA